MRPPPSGGGHTPGPAPRGGTRENGAPPPGWGGSPGSAPRAPGSTGTRSIWAWGHRDWPHAGGGTPGPASYVTGTRRSLTGPRGPTRPHTGFPVLPHATSLTPAPLRGRTLRSPAGCIWARPGRGFGHCLPWRTPRPCRGQDPSALQQILLPPSTQGQGCGRQAPSPLPYAKSRWCNSLSRGKNPPVSGQITLRRSVFVRAGSCVPRCHKGHGAPQELNKHITEPCYCSHSPRSLFGSASHMWIEGKGSGLLA